MAKQNSLSLEEYQQAMLVELDQLDEDRLMALERIEASKRRMASAYNKHVKLKKFVEGDLVWKTILPIGVKDPKFGKWSPNWEGPFIVSQVFAGNAYRLVNMQGEELNRSVNGKYLKRYYPTVWEGILEE